MSDPHPPRPEDGPDDEAEGLAAEYVLGTLPLAERLAVEKRVRMDSAFAARITAWEHRLAPLNDGYAPLPPPDLLPQIEARLFGRPEGKPRRGFGRFWGLIGGVATAAALMLVVFLALPFDDPGPPALTATLAAEAQPLVFAALYDPATEALTLTRTAGSDAVSGRSYELWLIVGTAAPVSLGLIDSATTTRALPGLAPGAVLAISLEPAGGSTTGAPSGPVLVTGEVAAL